MNLSPGDSILGKAQIARDWNDAYIKSVVVSSVNRAMNQVVVLVTTNYGGTRNETWNYAHVESAVRQGLYQIVPGNKPGVVEIPEDTFERVIDALNQITDLAYRLAMKAPDLNPEVDRIIPEAREALRELATIAGR